MTPEKLAAWMIKQYVLTLDNLYIMQSVGNLVVVNLGGAPTAIERPVYNSIIEQLTEAGE